MAANLQIRGIVHFSGSILCCFCKSNIETSCHIFIFCNISYSVWMYVYNWLGLDKILVGNLRELLLQHAGLLIGRRKKIWKMFWFAIIWSLWLHHNELIFKQGSLDFDKAMDLIKIRVWTSCNGLVRKGRFLFTDWSINPLFCIQSAH